ncbi:MAG: T9SS type A sorting domain-containing protein [Chitinophagaceae bacterium]|nr:T9SS type A sorting domain-containing protein [Chitinophagaceae bacterium]
MRLPAYVSLFLALSISFFTHTSVLSQPLSWQSRGVGGGGALFYPTINPLNDNEFYIACDMSQLFHSTDFGQSYSVVPFTKLQVGNLSTYEFTSNPSIAYCTANDGNINYGVRTLNGGNSWSPLPGNPLDGEDVFALKADHANPGRVILNYFNSIYISTDTGKTFSLVANAVNTDAGITVAGVFFDGVNIYIGTNEGIFHSSNSGSSFSKLVTTGIPVGQGIFSFAGAKSGGITRFVCIAANNADIYNGMAPSDYWEFAKGVYSFDPLTNAWTSRLTGINLANDFLMYVGMAKNDINTIYLAGSDGNTGGNLVMKSINGGANWSKVFLTTNNQNIRTGWSGHGGDRGWGYGESCFGIAVAANNSNKVIFGDFGFVHKTSDGGATWQQAYVNPADEHVAGSPTPQDDYYRSIGIENTTAWQLHWQDATNLFACFSDINGIRSTDAGVSWSFDYTGHSINTMYRIAKHISSNTMFAGTSGIHDMYQSTRLQDNILDVNDAGGRIIYSSNNGAAWQLLHQFNHPVFWVATDPTNANRMYASVIHYGGGTGEGGIWVTSNLNLLASSTWTKLPNPPRTQGHPASIVVLNDGKVLCTFSGRRTSGGVFTASSGVFIYDPVSTTWQDVSHADMQYWTKDIIIDPSDPTQNTWYVAVFSGWGGAPNGKGGLYRSTNRGANWTKLTGTQFDRVTSITFNPTALNQAYLTTEVQGLWMSNNINTANPTWTLVENYPFRQPERVFFNPFNSNEIWVTSFGNGLKVGTLSGTLPIRLLTFTGTRNQGISKLEWTTTTEDGNETFQLERSIDGRTFASVQQLQSKGSGNHQYNAVDVVPGSNIYYRLGIKNNSTTTYSRVLSFTSSGRESFVRLKSNPIIGSQVNIEFQLTQLNNVEFTLSTLSGAQVFKVTRSIQAGNSQSSLALPTDLPKGVYILKVNSIELKSSFRVLK